MGKNGAKNGWISDHCKEEESWIIKRNQTDFGSYRFDCKDTRKCAVPEQRKDKCFRHDR